jgi:hypothetical protein
VTNSAHGVKRLSSDCATAAPETGLARGSGLVREMVLVVLEPAEEPLGTSFGPIGAEDDVIAGADGA